MRLTFSTRRSAVGGRDFTFALPEGHRIGVSGATTPTRWAQP